MRLKLFKYIKKRHALKLNHLQPRGGWPSTAAYDEKRLKILKEYLHRAHRGPDEAQQLDIRQNRKASVRE